MKKVLVIGAGASGLMAAITAARNGADVTVLEAMEKPGKKLLITGNGRCNLTNMNPSLAEVYHGAAPEFVKTVIESFDAEQTRDFFRSIGLLTTERNGYVYPSTSQSSSVLNVLLTEAKRRKIKLKFSEKVRKIRKEEEKWLASTDTWTYEADAMILACGSRAASATGSDGSGYLLADQAGLKRNPEAPALVPLICRERFFPKLAGLRTQADLTLAEFDSREKSRRIIGKESGEVQWTKYGISGIAVFQLSRFISLNKASKQFCMELDLLPEFEKSELSDELSARAKELKQEKAAVLLNGVLPDKLIPVLMETAGITTKKSCAEFGKEDADCLIALCKCFPVHPVDTKDFESAQVCAGGVDTTQLDPRSMECRRQKGLYVTGELLDADGPCGGYNLQWAWSTGYCAGRHAAGTAKDS